VGLRNGEMLVSAPTAELDAGKLSVLYTEEAADHDDHRA
jgi:phosphonate transport system ATP-binding protein